ncbi:MAG: putative phosphatase YcdX [Firmicutes bacterium]|nr:putative phosphatase YcdX [candidate division NPL-UPA2 bacterium]
MVKADTHVHTIASGHAYGTVQEMAVAAREKGLELIALCDHGPSLPGAPHRYYFSNLLVLPHFIAGVEVLRGIEANMLNERGELDLERRFLERLDWVAAGFHDDCVAPMSRDLNTQAILGAISTGLVDVIVHPGNPQFPIHHEIVVRAIAEAGIAMEVNNASLIYPHRRGSEKNCVELIGLAIHYGANIVLGSDAHSPWQVGEVGKAYELAVSCGVPPAQILNFTANGVREYLKRRGKPRYIADASVV